MPAFPRRENIEGISIIFAQRMTEIQPDIRKMSLAEIQAWFELHKQPEIQSQAGIRMAVEEVGN
jgi:hypothetical protein